jgi:hypothetical protein
MILAWDKTMKYLGSQLVVMAIAAISLQPIFRTSVKARYCHSNALLVDMKRGSEDYRAEEQLKKRLATKHREKIN